MKGWHYGKGLIYYYYFLTFKAHLPRAIMGPMALELAQSSSSNKIDN